MERVGLEDENWESTIVLESGRFLKLINIKMINLMI